MKPSELHINQLIEIIADAITHDKDLDPALHGVFFQTPEICLDILKALDKLDESVIENEENDDGFLAACVYALEICLSQLQTEIENGARNASKVLEKCMQDLALLLNQGNHSLPFWLPALNAFYDVGIELSDELKNAYFELAQNGYPEEAQVEYDHIEAIRALIAQSKELSDFEIAENFFSQTYAMPADFFVDLTLDLMTLDEGQSIGLLFLMHPNPEVRHFVIEALDEVIYDLELTAVSLSRLQIIHKWYPESLKTVLDTWIKHQRKKGVIFATKHPAKMTKLKATEVDGINSQGLFIQLSQNRKHRLCGLLLKMDTGIKDVWLTQPMTAGEAKSHFQSNLQENVTLKTIDSDYCQKILNHFLAMTLSRGNMPSLNFMYLQELLPFQFSPEALDISQVLQELCLAITPFTQDAMTASFKRSKNWLSQKSFTESWFSINADIDRIVNQHSSIVDGIKLCQFSDACIDVMKQVFENQRDKWLFHFLWMAMWMKCSARKTDKAWQDCLFIAYTINNDTPLKEIPLLRELCNLSVQHSIETMQERKTHLH